MAIVLVQSKTAITAGATSLGAAWGSNTTTGNLLVVVAYLEWGGGIPAMTIADTSGNTWHQIFETDPDVSDIAVWYAWNCVGGTLPTVTITSTIGSAAIGIMMREYSGIQNSSDPLDKTVNATATSTALSSGATAATTQAAELVVGVGETEFSADTITVGAGYGNLLVQNSATIPRTFAMQDKIVAATGAQTSTMTAGHATPWIAAVATFKATGAAPVVLPPAPKFFMQAVMRSGNY
jgi:hypothetical protein